MENFKKFECTLAEQVFSNPLTISAIYANLPFTDARSCLLLTGTWYSTCISIFRRDFVTVISLNELHDMEEYIRHYSEQPEAATANTEFRFSSALNLSHVANGETLVKLFSYFGPHITWLEAHVDYGSSSELAQFASILSKLVNLVELHLHLDKTEINRTNSYPTRDLVVPSLQKLRLHYKSHAPWGTSDFMEEFIPLFPNLSHLQLPPCIPGVVEPKQTRFSSMVVKWLLDNDLGILDGRLARCPRIKGVGIMLHTIIRHLNHLWEGVEELELYDSCFWTADVNQMMTRILSHANSGTLRKLKMPINLTYGRVNYHSAWFPQMVNLEELELEFIVRVQNVHHFSGTNIPETFPNLRKLKIMVTCLDNGEECAAKVDEVINSFIPKITNDPEEDAAMFISKSLRHLEIVSNLDADSSRLERRDRISKFFPKLEKYVRRQVERVQGDGEGVLFIARNYFD